MISLLPYLLRYAKMKGLKDFYDQEANHEHILILHLANVIAIVSRQNLPRLFVMQRLQGDLQPI